MLNNVLERLLAGEWIDPKTQNPFVFPLKHIVINEEIHKSPESYLLPLGLGKTLAIISDERTWEVLGKAVESAIGGQVRLVSVRLPGIPKADEATVQKIRAATEKADALVAVGSGTINDLCKYASFQDKKPYVVFGTAPSMNGYVSSNAAITIKDHKKSVAAHLPAAVFLDLKILSEAPLRLIRSGVGDMLCRPTAQADWLLSHLLLGTHYTETPFLLLEESEGELFASVKGLLAKDKSVMAALANALLLSGIGMYYAGASYPASQGEHMLAHTMEMVYGEEIPPTYHGEQIGVTTLAMVQLQQEALKTRPYFTPTALDDAVLLAYFGKKRGAECIEEYKKKRLSPEACERLNTRLETEWDSIRERIEAVMMPYTILYKVLETIGAPTTPGALGWSDAKFAEVMTYARYTRDRFTFLDITGELRQ
ncbi:MAG: putative glycerol-phosphate dehydrogenase [Rickettsiales bacterium]|jgi:glycerol-1-phosphate dehydrogenase [NAD(P)+]|nr:putative glycerol-phosphate dehydrogenase [Rickettsiales bacterium]